MEMKTIRLFFLNIFIICSSFNLFAADGIKASGGENCFRSLDAKDVESLSSIIDIREDVAQSLDSTNSNIEKQKALIEANYTGEKKTAAYAILSFSIAEANKAAIKRVINKVLSRGETTINENDKKQISSLVKEAEQNGFDLEAAINLQSASLASSAELLKSKGAQINANGDWIFSPNFNFGEIKTDPSLNDALKAFFPEEVAELSNPWRSYARIGNRVVTNIPGTKKNPKEDTNWIWASADLQEHSQKLITLIDRFVKKSEEYLRLSKENNHWIKLTGAALDANLIEGSCKSSSVLSILGGPIFELAEYVTGRENSNKKWLRDENIQLKVLEELGNIQLEIGTHGAPDQTKQMLREAYARLSTAQSENREVGIAGMERALTAVALSPLAVVGAPAILGGGAIAGATTTAGTVLAVATTTLGYVSIITPAVIATKNIYKAVKSGDGALCSAVKYGAVVGVSTIETLKWGAMAPILKGLSPVFSPIASSASKVLNLGPAGQKIAKFGLILPGATLNSWGLKNLGEGMLTNEQAISNIELTLNAAKESNNPKSVAVLEEMLEKAKEQRWDLVVGIANSSIGLLGSIKNAVEASAKSKKVEKVEKIEKVELAQPAQPVRKINDDVRDRIIAIPKGKRPDPKTYHSEKHIAEHLEKFEGGATRFVTKRSLDKYGPARSDGTAFVLTKDEADKLLASVKSKDALEKALGLPSGTLISEKLIRVDFPAPKNTGLRLPSGNEDGANAMWIPGGVLPEGTLEAVIDVTAKTKWTQKPVNIP